MRSNAIGFAIFATFMIAAVLVLKFGFVEAGRAQTNSDKGAAIISDYGPRPINRQQAVRFHLALKLLSGARWSPEQKADILEALSDPARSLESRVAEHFARAEAVDVFYRIGTADIEDLREVYRTPFGKGELIANWTPERKANLWRQNLALGFARYELSLAQQRFLIDLAGSMPTNRQQAEPWEASAKILFTRKVGRGLFATIGETRCPSGAIASLGQYFQPTCVCTTNSGNWSCNDSCHGAGTCTVDPGNCGFLWLWDCNGMCNNGDMELP